MKQNPPSPESGSDSTADFAVLAATEAAEHLKQGVARAGEAIAALQVEVGLLREHIAGARATIALQEAQNVQLQDQHLQLQSESAQLQSENAQLQSENAQLQSENAQLQSENSQLQSESAQLQSENVGLKSESAQLHGENAKLHGENAQLQRQHRQLESEEARLQERHAQLQGENAGLQRDNEVLKEEQDRLESHRLELQADLECERAQNHQLHKHIHELHFDLQAENVPLLALKLAMQLTGAEVGLFTEADGDGILARVGLRELEDFLQQAVYDYSRRVAKSEEPAVENDAKKLPDGAGLINLAALPFASKGKMSGVLLLANKRSGHFTDAECQILLAIGQHAGLAIENAKLHAQLIEAYTSTVAVLADAIEAKDAYTRGHCEGVSRISTEVARRLGVVDGALEAVRYAALLHDVGKIGIPDGILLKPGKLMPEEFSIIQKHAAIGRDLIGRVPMLSHICDAILHHHEHFDGSGYPDGLDGENIPLASRIIGVVDAFDAMTSPRPYRDSLGTDAAFAEMERCSGTQFDPQIVAMALQVLLETEIGENNPV